jgi:hypothetical protein
MHEDRAAAAPDTRKVIISEHDHEVIEMIIAHQALGASHRRKLDATIVVPVARIVAPAVAGTDRAHRNTGPRREMTVRPIQDLPQGEAAGGRGAIAFPLQRFDPGVAERSPTNTMGQN